MEAPADLSQLTDDNSNEAGDMLTNLPDNTKPSQKSDPCNPIPKIPSTDLSEYTTPTVTPTKKRPRQTNAPNSQHTGMYSRSPGGKKIRQTIATNPGNAVLHAKNYKMLKKTDFFEKNEMPKTTETTETALKTSGSSITKTKSPDVRAAAQTTPCQMQQFKSIYEPVVYKYCTEISSSSKYPICYICGCPIIVTQDDAYKRDNTKEISSASHHPEMEHVITGEEFYLKFGIELVTQKKTKFFTKLDIDNYQNIHETGSDGKTDLLIRLDNARTFLNNSAIISIFEELSLPCTYPLTKGQELSKIYSVKYQPAFFIPQIKGYAVEFAYAHNICNQIKGNMPILKECRTVNSDGTYEHYKSADVLPVENNISKFANTLYYAISTGIINGHWDFSAILQSRHAAQEMIDIKKCWTGLDASVIKNRIKQNMLYHSILLDEIRLECTKERLKNLDYIDAFTTYAIKPAGSTDKEDDAFTEITEMSNAIKEADDIDENDIPVITTLVAGSDTTSDKKNLLLDLLNDDNFNKRVNPSDDHEYKHWTFNNILKDCNLMNEANLLASFIIYKTYRTYTIDTECKQHRKGGGRKTKKRIRKTKKRKMNKKSKTRRRK
jgi:hypothetical protein